MRIRPFNMMERLDKAMYAIDVREYTDMNIRHASFTAKSIQPV